MILASELVYSIARLCEPCLEHTDNNFNPLDAIQKGEFGDVAEDITYLIQQCRKKLESNDYNDFEEKYVVPMTLSPTFTLETSGVTTAPKAKQAVSE